MLDCDGLLREVMAQAEAAGIPFSRKIDLPVVVNSRSVTRFGCCRSQGDRFRIEVARRVAQGEGEQGRRACMEVLAHELLHTCWGCRNHGKRWRAYAQRMNDAYGYHIARTSTSEALGVAQARPFRYLVRCLSCGAEFRRFRASPLTEHPERYRCKCGGALVRCPLTEEATRP